MRFVIGSDEFLHPNMGRSDHVGLTIVFTQRTRRLGNFSQRLTLFADECLYRSHECTSAFLFDTLHPHEERALNSNTSTRRTPLLRTAVMRRA